MKILIIKPSSFGDIIHAAPCAAALKKVYPNAEISWVVFKQWKDLPLLFPDIDKIFLWDRKNGLKGFFDVLREIRKFDFDIIFDLQGLIRSALLAKASRGKIKLGVPGMKEFSDFLIKEVYPQNALMNATLRNLEPLRFLTGKTIVPQIDIKINEESLSAADKLLFENGISGSFMALLPFARGKGKDWSINNYLKLIDMIKEKFPDKEIVVLGSDVDRGKIKSDKIKDLCGKTDISLLAAVLSKSFAAVGADTGPMHLASVLNVASVFIFGDSDIKETSPYIGKFCVVSNKENRKEINKITPQEVFDALCGLIK